METHAMSVLGLTWTEEEVYRHFLRNPYTPERDIKESLQADDGSVARALERLRDLRLLHGDSESMWATEPDAAVTRLVEDRLETLHGVIRQLAHTQPILRSLQRDHVPRPGKHSSAVGAMSVERLEDVRQVRDRIDHLAFTAHEEILSAEPYESLSRENIAHSRPLDLRCLRRGVRIRNLVRACALEDPLTMDYLRELHAHGAQIRVLGEFSELMLVYDRHTALVPIDADDTARGALCTREHGLVGSIVTLFERLWAAAGDFAGLGGAATGQALLLSEAQRAVLACMCTVSKDEAGARRTGMSLRTYRRHIADLMRLLGARNRAHAALLAREQGWV